MIAKYDLAYIENPPTFDFFGWLCHAQSLGATEIVVDDSNPRDAKYLPHVIQERIRSIIIPGAAFAGLPARRGSDGELAASTSMRELAKYPHFRRLVSIKRPMAIDYTVTIRQQSHN